MNNAHVRRYATPFGGTSAVVVRHGDPHPRRILSPRRGYDLAAPYYDTWHWQRFWRENEYRHVLKWVPVGGRFADIGCGTGAYCKELLRLGRPVGIDPSVKMLEQAQKNLPPEVDLRLGSTQVLPLETGSVDLALTTRVLSHERNLVRVASEIARVMTPGGDWVLTDVHAEHPYPCTRIPTPGGDVFIETVKRTPQEIEKLVCEHGLFALLETRVFFADDLSWLPDSVDFVRIDRTGRKPVFFLQVFRRV